MDEWIAFDLVILFMVMSFVAVALWAYKRKDPMHFWSGTTVDPETITDIKKYNKANAKMWLAYCVPMLVSMFIAPFNMHVASGVLIVSCVAGIPVLIITYNKIKKKYTR